MGWFSALFKEKDDTPLTPKQVERVCYTHMKYYPSLIDCRLRAECAFRYLKMYGYKPVKMESINVKNNMLHVYVEYTEYDGSKGVILNLPDHKSVGKYYGD